MTGTAGATGLGPITHTWLAVEGGLQGYSLRIFCIHVTLPQTLFNMILYGMMNAGHRTPHSIP